MVLCAHVPSRYAGHRIFVPSRHAAHHFYQVSMLVSSALWLWLTLPPGSSVSHHSYANSAKLDLSSGTPCLPATMSSKITSNANPFAHRSSVDHLGNHDCDCPPPPLYQPSTTVPSPRPQASRLLRPEASYLPSSASSRSSVCSRPSSNHDPPSKLSGKKMCAAGEEDDEKGSWAFIIRRYAPRKQFRGRGVVASMFSHMKTTRLCAIRSDSAKNRVLRQRKSWSAFSSSLTDRQFRRYFRMSRGCFQHLCDQIETNVGEEIFKSEAYLIDIRGSIDEKDKKTIEIMRAHEQSTVRRCPLAKCPLPQCPL